MTNRQNQRDAVRERRRQERQQARHQQRQQRPATTASGPTQRMPQREAAVPSRKGGFNWLWAIVGGIAIVAILGGIVYAVRSVNQPLPGQVFASQGNTHINPGDPHPAYNSNPPTSGWHYPTWPQRGIYTQPLPPEYMLHFQEHAGVVVHYDPSKLPADQVKQLHDIVESELNTGQGLVLLAPDPTIPDPIDITAWQHKVALQQVNGNKAKIQDAIERLQCAYDPEGVCGPPHGNSFQSTATVAAGQATVVGAPIPANAPAATAAPNQRSDVGGQATATPAP